MLNRKGWGSDRCDMDRSYICKKGMSHQYCALWIKGCLIFSLDTKHKFTIIENATIGDILCAKQREPSKLSFLLILIKHARYYRSWALGWGNGWSFLPLTAVVYSSSSFFPYALCSHGLFPLRIFVSLPKPQIPMAKYLWWTIIDPPSSISCYGWVRLL